MPLRAVATKSEHRGGSVAAGCGLPPGRFGDGVHDFGIAHEESCRRRIVPLLFSWSGTAKWRVGVL